MVQRHLVFQKGPQQLFDIFEATEKRNHVVANDPDNVSACCLKDARIRTRPPDVRRFDFALRNSSVDVKTNLAEPLLRPQQSIVIGRIAIPWQEREKTTDIQAERAGRFSPFEAACSWNQIELQNIELANGASPKRRSISMKKTGGLQLFLNQVNDSRRVLFGDV
jgi:hypothetical protein